MKKMLENLIENGETVENINNKVIEVNKTLYKNHCKMVAIAENPSATLYKKNTCVVYRFNAKTRELTETDKKVKFADVEKEYRMLKSVATDKNGKALSNHDVTILNHFKVHSALQSFIKICNNEVAKDVYTFDANKYTDKSIKLDFADIMDNNTALDRAINNVLKIVGISATYKKKYNDALRHFATKQKINAKGITISDTTVYDLMDYIVDCCKDRVSVKLSYMAEKKIK